MRSLLLMGAICALVVGLAAGASAEPFVRGSVGVAIPIDQQVVGENPDTFSYSDFDPENSVAVGVAVGYWLDNFPYIGIEGSIQLWFPDIDEQQVKRENDDESGFNFLFKSEVDAFSFGLVGLARFPIGNLVPYGGGGMTFTHLDLKHTQVNGLTVRSDDDLFPTLTFKGGLTWYLLPNVGLFVEYKFINKHFDTIIGRDGNDPRALDSIDVNMDVHFIEGGIEWRFWEPTFP